MEAYVLDGVYTPRASVKKGASAYSSVHPQELLATCLRSLKTRNADAVTHTQSVLAGCVSQVSEQGANLARNALLLAGFDHSVSAATLNMCCGSGLETINLAAASVAAGSEDLVIAGGIESMSRVPMASDGGGMDGGNETLRKELVQLPQGICADFLATRDRISRQELDSFALESHRKATRAMQAGEFDQSYALVMDCENRPLLERDNHVRFDSNIESLNSLKPAFQQLAEVLKSQGLIGTNKPLSQIDYLHTAGTSSGIADGAGTVLLANQSFLQKSGAKPKAKILATVSMGCDPITMLTGPGQCSREAVHKANLSVDDIDLWEINEAFAIVPIQTIRSLKLNEDRVNVRGGAIALGHPLGATGAILLTSMIDSLISRNLSIGCVVLCVAGGQSIATIVQRC